MEDKNPKCRYKYCHNRLMNQEVKVCCEHWCHMCHPLYGSCNSVIEHNEKLHAITEKSNLKILDMTIYNCPNVKLFECPSLKKGYLKSEKCIGTVHDFYMCKYCININLCKCKFHNDVKLRSLDPILINNNLPFCDNCIKYGKCINCDEYWFYTSDPDKKYSSVQINNPKMGPKLCKNCISNYKACCKCNKLFDNDTIEFLEYAYNDENYCTNCNLTNNCNVRTVQKSSLICWRMKVDTFLEPIKKIYCDFNPNNIKFDDVFEIAMALLWGCQNREIYLDSMISIIRDKNFSNRLKRINKNMQITYCKERYFITNEYIKLNLLALLVRCALLPTELFFIILNMI